ncbi:MAG: hypothetical protein JOZ96_13635 [Acidobacteria bacterium]|nr:hypothetical protein [Acidobacteriota bacterium]
MDLSEMAFATMTWARDAEEERLLRESLPLLANLGAPVFVADGGSGEQFLNFIRGLPTLNVIETGRPGVWHQACTSIEAAFGASGAKFILYTESDKRDFFREDLREFVAEAPAGGDVGVVLASRSPESFRTFPEFQRHTETTVNRCCTEVLGLEADFTYGPFILNRALVPHVAKAQSDFGWGWRPYAFATARRLGYGLRHVERHLPCPLEQREDDAAERLYRMRQLAQNVQGLLGALAGVRGC